MAGARTSRVIEKTQAQADYSMSAFSFYNYKNNLSCRMRSHTTPTCRPKTQESRSDDEGLY